MATATELLNVARSQIGYREGANNNNKYGQAYGMNNVSWCVQFVWWCFQQVDPSLFYGGGKIAICSGLYNYHKARGEAINPIPGNIWPGDIVIFDFNKDRDPDHIGIVESISGSTLTTIEGNTGYNNQSNGDGVYRRSRTLSQVIYAYHPRYSKTSTTTSTPTPTPTPTTNSSTSSNTASTIAVVKELQKALNARGAKLTVDGIYGNNTANACSRYIVSKGSRNACVSWVQSRLNVKGYTCGQVDGIFGSGTRASVISFQKAKGLTADGVVGKNTYKALI